MRLIKLAGFFVLTLSFHSIEGKSVLLFDGDKDAADMKPSEKRTSSFRMNVETPFDPNFWPARGRRGGKDPEKLDDCLENYYEFQCRQETKGQTSDSDPGSPDLDSGASFERSYGSPPELKKKFASEGRIFQRLDRPVANKRRRQKVLPLSRVLSYGPYYEPGNSLGEKMKKQDVFWVVRGKKNFQ